MLAALIPVLGPILDRTLGALIPDPAERQKMIAGLFGQLATADLSQMEVNKVEAASPSVFVSGWRPAVGWVCVVALAWHFVVMPLLCWIFVLFNVPWAPPAVGLDDRLWELLFGLLGMGALRSLEKLKGVASK